MRVITNASVDPVASAGSVWSSVADMSKWMRFVLDSGRVDGKHLLKPETFAELLKPQTTVPPGQFYPSARLTRPHWVTYALGWFQQDYDGRAVSFHTGSIDGMVAIIGLIPDERLGVYVLANADHVELRHALMLKAFDLWGPSRAKSRDWSTELPTLYSNQRAQAVAATKAAEAKRVTGTKPSLPIGRYAGVYADSLFGEATVRGSSDNDLRLRIGTLEGALEHWQYDTFRGRWDKRWVVVRPPAPATLTPAILMARSAHRGLLIQRRTTTVVRAGCGQLSFSRKNRWSWSSFEPSLSVVQTFHAVRGHHVDPVDHHYRTHRRSAREVRDAG